jgi:hypothetical protein
VLYSFSNLLWCIENRKNPVNLTGRNSCSYAGYPLAINPSPSTESTGSTAQSAGTISAGSKAAGPRTTAIG